MFVLGSLREIIGNGTLFDGADALLGSWAKVLRVEIFHTDFPAGDAATVHLLASTDAGRKIPD